MFDAGSDTLAFGLLAGTEADRGGKSWGCHLCTPILRTNIMESSHFFLFSLSLLLYSCFLSLMLPIPFRTTELAGVSSCHFSIAYVANSEIQMSHAALYTRGLFLEKAVSAPREVNGSLISPRCLVITSTSFW